jgi:hypothetical protein
MRKRKPSQRRQSETTPQQPRNRLAEIRAEIRDVQQQIETKRRESRVIRTAEDFKSGTFSKPSSNGRPPWTIPVGTCAIVGVIP